jgi:hypothetical protein
MVTSPGLFFSAGLRRSLERFDNPQPAYDKLVNLQVSNLGAADCQAADGKRTDGQRADRRRTQRESAQRLQCATGWLDLAGPHAAGFLTQPAGETPAPGIASAHCH